MKRSLIMLTGCATIMLVVAVSQAQPPVRGVDAANPRVLFQRLDADDNHEIGLDEIPDGAPDQLKSLLEAADRDGDGVVTPQEFGAQIQQRTQRMANASRPTERPAAQQRPQRERPTQPAERPTAQQRPQRERPSCVGKDCEGCPSCQGRPGSQGRGLQGPGSQARGSQGRGPQGPPMMQGRGPQGHGSQARGSQGRGPQGPPMMQGRGPQGHGSQARGSQGRGPQGPPMMQGRGPQGPGSQARSSQDRGPQKPTCQGSSCEGCESGSCPAQGIDDLPLPPPPADAPMWPGRGMGPGGPGMGGPGMGGPGMGPGGPGMGGFGPRPTDDDAE
jgi:hypothetical protein